MDTYQRKLVFNGIERFNKLKSTLFLCNTYYQLIVAIQMKLTLFSDRSVGIWITDHSSDAEKIVARLAHINLFQEVRFIEVRESEKAQAAASKLKRSFDSIKLNFGESQFPSVEQYEEVIFYNCSKTVYEICKSRRPLDKPLKFYRMEESSVSCRPSTAQWRPWARVSDIIRRVTGRPVISGNIKDFYCFLPELCPEDFPLTPIQIPSPMHNKKELVDILKRIFDYEKFPYSQKYIFFASSLEIDGCPIGEERVVSQLTQSIGKDNLLIKMHPRDGRSVYEDTGVAVMKESFIPWEIIQLCEDFSERVFLTCISSSPLAISAMLNESVKTRYLMPSSLSRTESENLDRFYRRTVVPTLDRFHQLGLCKCIYESSLEDFIREIELGVL